MRLFVSIHRFYPCFAPSKMKLNALNIDLIASKLMLTKILL